MRPRLAIAAVALCGVAATACSGAGATTSPRESTPPPPTGCALPAGGRCPGPAPVTSALIGHLYLASRDQRALFGRFLCGGRLHVREVGDRVLITYVASRVPAGAMTCARVTLSVRLDKPLDGRTVVDATTGHVLPIGVLPNA